jgi:hypothetical protein
MATITIKINTATVPEKAVIVLGDYQHVKNLSQTVSVNKPPVVSTHHGVSRTQESFIGGLVISQYEQSYDQEIFKRWNWGMIAELATLIEKNKVSVKLDGAAQTATQIRAMYTST